MYDIALKSKVFQPDDVCVAFRENHPFDVAEVISSPVSVKIALFASVRLSIASQQEQSKRSVSRVVQVLQWAFGRSPSVDNSFSIVKRKTPFHLSVSCPLVADNERECSVLEMDRRDRTREINDNKKLCQLLNFHPVSSPSLREPELHVMFPCTACCVDLISLVLSTRSEVPFQSFVQFWFSRVSIKKELVWYL